MSWESLTTTAAVHEWMSEAAGKSGPTASLTSCCQVWADDAVGAVGLPLGTEGEEAR